MKITQLPLGARFILDGKTYVKSGPMLGTCDGAQRFIPKYALLTPVDGIPAQAPAAPSDSLSRATVEQALAAFYQECQGLLPAERQDALAAARERFLQAIA
jgi:hypothetical protein